MPKYIKSYKQFVAFVKSVETEITSVHERKLINLFLSYFDNIVEKGTHNSLRSKYVYKLFSEKGEETLEAITYPNIDEQEDVTDFKRIISLELENFRGFSSKETFNLSKQYTFIYGPNGTGKSSFFEALEYSMLGFIQAAIDKNIDVREYIKNQFTEKQTNPKLLGQTQTGEEQEIKPNSSFGFCFIEKSRIDQFAKISANSEKGMEKQLASLFGLEEFNKFVNDFSKDVEKYFGLENLIEKSLNEKTAETENRKKDVTTETTVLESNKVKRAKIITDAGFETKEIFESAHLKAPEGKVTKTEELNEKLKSSAPKILDFKGLEEMKKAVDSEKEDYESLSRMLKELSIRKSEVQFKDLFSSALELENLAKDFCPLCETPLSAVHIHPFENARAKLKELNEIIELENRAQKLMESFFEHIKGLDESLAVFNSCLADVGEGGLVFFEKGVNEKSGGADLLEHYKNIKNFFDNKNSEYTGSQKKLEKQNQTIQEAINARALIQTELAAIDLVKNSYVEINALVENSEKRILDWKKEIADFDASNADLIKKVTEEKAKIAENRIWLNAYTGFLERITKYKDELPIRYVGELSELTCSIFNQINLFDKEYERAETITLPKSTEDVIQITFSGNSEKKLDALCVLSEGHLRCLGLAILISKNIKEECPVIIFDDVVNAIDTEHRKGIRELIFNHEPLSDRQVIITTHDENFATKLASKVPKEKSIDLVQTYNFNLDEKSRKINVDQDTRNHLQKAFEEYQSGRIEESLNSCRLALENTAFELWDKLRKIQQIPVAVFGPNERPHLRVLVDKLKAHIKKNNIEKYLGTLELFDFLVLDSNWDYLNKSHHEGEDKPILDKDVVKEILAKCASLDLIVKASPGAKKDTQKASVEKPPVPLSVEKNGQTTFL